MYRGNRNSKIVHSEKCGHGRRMKKENTEWFYAWDEAMISRYKVCSCCNPDIKKTNGRPRDIRDFCDRNEIKLNLMDETLYISSVLGKWILHTNDAGKMELLHKNTWGEKGEYHLQTSRIDSLMKALQYIKDHDTYRMYNPLPMLIKKKKPEKKEEVKSDRVFRLPKKSRRKYEIKQFINHFNGLAAAY